MELLRDWMLSGLAAALALSLLRALMPKGGAGKVGELAIGLVLFVVILRPLAEALPSWLSGSFVQQVEAASAYPDDLTVANERYLEDVMSRRCGEYIESQGQALGLEVDANVTCVWQEGYPVPDQVLLQGERSEALERYIVSELGILPQNIRYEGVEQ